MGSIGLLSSLVRCLGIYLFLYLMESWRCMSCSNTFYCSLFSGKIMKVHLTLSRVEIFLWALPSEMIFVQHACVLRNISFLIINILLSKPGLLNESFSLILGIILLMFKSDLNKNGMYLYYITTPNVLEFTESIFKLLNKRTNCS